MGKGYTFSVNRLCEKLRRHYGKHGTDGYILLFDFSKFFERVSHELVKRILRGEFHDAKLLRLIEHFIDAFGNIGMGLGSQISQILALASASRLDHGVTELLRIGQYGRYMDDGYLIHRDKEYLKECLSVIQRICDELKIVLNTKKTQIVKLSHGFTYLKIRFFILPTGKIIRKIYKRSVTKERQKLKAFAEKIQQGLMTFSDVWSNWQSWKSYASNFNAKQTVYNIGQLFNDLFITKWRDHYALQSAA